MCIWNSEQNTYFSTTETQKDRVSMLLLLSNALFRHALAENILNHVGYSSLAAADKLLIPMFFNVLFYILFQ